MRKAINEFWERIIAPFRFIYEFRIVIIVAGILIGLIFFLKNFAP